MYGVRYSIKLGEIRARKQPRASEISKLQRHLLRANRNKHKAQADLAGSAVTAVSQARLEAAVTAVTHARSDLKRAERAQQRQLGLDRDMKLKSVISGNCRDIFKSIKSSKSSSSKINSIHVSSKVYQGDHVPDGFFDSMSSLKCPDMSSIESSPHFQSTLADYENI